MDWIRLKRFFRLTGKLPGIHYEARVAILELEDVVQQPLDRPIERADLGRDVSRPPLGAGNDQLRRADA